MAGRPGRAKVSARPLLLVLAAVIGMATIAVMGALQVRSTIEEEQRSQAEVATGAQETAAGVAEMQSGADDLVLMSAELAKVAGTVEQ